uniref:Signal recognition particle 19 kDa protein n=1 Tax=Monodelphis domestica TaxID=13616 RepID=A0A5F8HFP5_MONDO
LACAIYYFMDQDKFICIHPAYLNNKKTIAEGIQIQTDKAVENPTATEIQDVCLNVHIEKNKMYSRESISTLLED